MLDDTSVLSYSYVLREEKEERNEAIWRTNVLMFSRGEKPIRIRAVTEPCLKQEANKASI